MITHSNSDSCNEIKYITHYNNMKISLILQGLLLFSMQASEADYLYAIIGDRK